MSDNGQTTPIFESLAYTPDVVWNEYPKIRPIREGTYIVNIKTSDREFIDLGKLALETFTPTDGDTWPEGAEVTHWMQLPDPA